MPSPSETTYLIRQQLLQQGILGTTGKVFYVNSTATSGTSGTSAGFGRSPNMPFSTLAACLAIGSTAGGPTANNGDVIVLMPGHVESVATAAQVAVATAGLTIVSLGVGRNRATFNIGAVGGATSAQMTVTAANTVFRNCVFNMTALTAVVAAISVTAADVSFEDCEFVISTGTNAPVLGILTAATASRLRVIRCRFLGPAVSTATCTACIQHEVGVDYNIEDCDFHGKMTQAILNATTILGGRIHNNRFQVYTGTKGIALEAASTAFITNNRFNVPSGTAPIVAAAGFVAGNVYSAAAGVTAGTASTF